MLNKFLYIGCLYMGLLLSGCYNSKVDQLRLDLMEKQLAALEGWQQTLNYNLIALQGIVEALQRNKFIKSVTEQPDGYSLLLNDGTILQIHHGRQGEDGVDGKVVMPLISVRDSSDGHTYWTVNGNILLDEHGEGVRADGEKGTEGKPGEPGITGKPGKIPLIRINQETGFWEVSVDEGKTWSSTGVKAIGEKGDAGAIGPQGPGGSVGVQGDAVFAKDGVRIEEAFVEFTLTDGTRFRLPRYKSWKLEFSEGLQIEMTVGTTELFPFVLSGFGGIPSVNAVGSGGWQAEVKMSADVPDRGEIVIKAPDIVNSAVVLVFLSDNLGSYWTYSLQVVSLPE